MYCSLTGLNAAVGDRVRWHIATLVGFCSEGLRLGLLATAAARAGEGPGLGLEPGLGRGVGLGQWNCFQLMASGL
jgi:hypothetical protein